jgi:hypothetical protein
MFQIRHPASLLILGVFDFDTTGPLLQNNHAPIGRVVIHLNHFDPDTVYTLVYPLYHGDTQEEEVRTWWMSTMWWLWMSSYYVMVVLPGCGA